MHAIATDRGPRENLEDTAACIRLHCAAGRVVSIFVACDGVGGNNYGEIASTLASAGIIASLVAFFTGPSTLSGPPSPDDILDAQRVAVEEANRLIVEQGRSDPRLRGMATTAACAVEADSVLYGAWVGDSRCYLAREGGLRRLTKDHSVVQRLIDAGELDPKDADHHPQRHVIEQYLGKPEGLEIGTVIVRLRDGDEILLCTDGLSDVVTDPEIRAILRKSLEPGEAAMSLLRRALASNPTDNITAIVHAHECLLSPPAPQPTLTGGFASAFARTCTASTQGDLQ